jgi:hypothetical protein
MAFNGNEWHSLAIAHLMAINGKIEGNRWVTLLLFKIIPSSFTQNQR